MGFHSSRHSSPGEDGLREPDSKSQESRSRSRNACITEKKETRRAWEDLADRIQRREPKLWFQALSSENDPIEQREKKSEILRPALALAAS